MIEHKVFSHKWLSDGIGENYKIWTCKDRQKTLTSATCVLIESPTGTGKTSFVLDKLFPFAAQNGRNILYLGNRAALKAQTEYAVEHRFIERDREYENSYTKELNSAKLFYYPQTNCSITILNYQAFMGFSSQYLHGENPFYYIILDEAHFFLEDSLFNPMTAMILNKIMQDMQLINNAEQILKDQKKELSKQQKAEIYSYKLQYEKAVSAYYRELTALLQKHWLDGKQYINSLFYLNEYRNLVPNYIAYEKLLQLESFYSDLKENAANPNYWQFTVLNWLQSNNSRPEHLTMENHESLEEFLRYHTDNPVPEAEQEAFYNEFQHLYKQHCYELFGNNKTELKASLGIRKGKTQRKATMNKSLALLNLPYEVKKEKNCWVLRQKLH